MWRFIKIDKRGQPLFKHDTHGLGVLVEEGDYFPARRELEVKVRPFGGGVVEGVTKIQLERGALGRWSCPREVKGGGWGTMHKTLAPWDKGWSKERGPWPIDCPHTNPAFVAAWSPTSSDHANVNAAKLVQAVKDWSGWSVTAHSLRAADGAAMLFKGDALRLEIVRDWLLSAAPDLLNHDHRLWRTTSTWNTRAEVGVCVDGEYLLPDYEGVEGEALAGASPSGLRIDSLVELSGGRFVAEATDAHGRTLKLAGVYPSLGGGYASGSYFSSTGEDDD